MAGTPRSMLRHLLLDQVLPLVLTLHGRLAIHASCVQTPSGAIAFLGTSGRGKSTLCAAFAQRGFPVVCDDCLIVVPDGDRCRAVPSYPSLRLWPQSLPLLSKQSSTTATLDRHKQRLQVSAFCSVPVPLVRLFVLGPPTHRIRIRPVPFVRRFFSLVRHGIRLEVGRGIQLRREFHALERLAMTECRYLSYPRQLDQIEEVCAAVLHDLES